MLWDLCDKVALCLSLVVVVAVLAGSLLGEPLCFACVHLIFVHIRHIFPPMFYLGPLLASAVSISRFLPVSLLKATGADFHLLDILIASFPSFRVLVDSLVFYSLPFFLGSR